MKIAIEDILAQARIDRMTLDLWIRESWIAPARSDQDEFVFSETDLARARLISELIEDMGVNEEGIGVILDLLDQVHGLRRLLAVLREGDGGA